MIPLLVISADLDSMSPVDCNVEHDKFETYMDMLLIVQKFAVLPLTVLAVIVVVVILFGAKVETDIVDAFKVEKLPREQKNET